MANTVNKIFSMSTATQPKLTLGGRTVKYNQLVKNGNFEGTSNWNVINPDKATVTTSNNVITFEITNVAPHWSNGTHLTQGSKNYVENHKYLTMCEVYTDVAGTVAFYFGNVYDEYININANKWEKVATFRTQATTVTTSIQMTPFFLSSMAVGNIYKQRNFIQVDLTDIYGAGNEPTTVNQFLTDYPMYKKYVNYTGTNGGLYNLTAPFLGTGRNIVDEVFESGNINTTTGANYANANCIRTKNFIEIKPSTKYYVAWSDVATDASIFAFLYDENKNPIGVTNWDTTTASISVGFARQIVRSSVLENYFTTASNAKYIRFYCNQEYGTTYNNNILIQEDVFNDKNYIKHLEMNVKPTDNVLPLGYTQLTYIQSGSNLTDQCYIDTGYTPSTDPNVELYFENKHLFFGDTTADSCVGGVRNSNVSGGFHAIKLPNYYSGKVEVELYYTNTHLYTQQANEEVLFITKGKSGSQLFSYDLTTINTTITGNNNFGNYNIYLFALNRNNSPVWYFHGRIYYQIIKEDGVLKRYFIPCRRDSDSAVGMYDLVEGKFYGNAGTGNFVAGDVVPKFELKGTGDIKSLLGKQNVPFITEPYSVIVFAKNNGGFDKTETNLNQFNVINGHKYFLCFKADWDFSQYGNLYMYSAGSYQIISPKQQIDYQIRTATANGQSYIGIASKDLTKVYYAIVIDLTAIGLDNLTAQQFYDKYNKWFDYLASGGSISKCYDEYLVHKHTKNEYVASADLGSLDWGKNVKNQFYSFGLGSLIKKPANNDTKANIYWYVYNTETTSNVYYKTSDKAIGVYSHNGTIIVWDSSKENLTSYDFKTSLSGQILNYEKATMSSITTYNRTKTIKNIVNVKDINGFDVPFHY